MMRARRREVAVRLRLLACSLLALVALTPLPLAAADPGPQNVVRELCRLDANGARLLAGRWRDVAPLVAWPLDPGWDRVLFITGYQIGTTQPLEEGQLAVDVDYAVIGEVTAAGFEPVSYTDRVTFVLDTPDDVHWQIVAPMIAPRVFGSLAPADEIAATLAQGRGSFVPSSLFVNRVMRAAGWNVPYERAADLLSGRHYGLTDDPQPGDLVVYAQEGVAYHAGILREPGQVVSSTLNGGIVRTTLNAFLGEVHYLRLIEPAAPPTPTAAAAGP